MRRGLVPALALVLRIAVAGDVEPVTRLSVLPARGQAVYAGGVVKPQP